MADTIKLIDKIAGSTEFTFNANRAVEDSFGASVSVYSNTAIIGVWSQDYDVNGANYIKDTGAVYIYTRTSGVWTQQQKLVGSGINDG
jgi:hypothetical protein